MNRISLSWMNRDWIRWTAIATAAITMAIVFKLTVLLPAETPLSPIRRDRCEADPAYVFIPEGDYIAGSDRLERSYAYRISAASIADTPEAIAQADDDLRRRGWFNREPSRQSRTLPPFCLARNLVTNADYQRFVQATGHRVPSISADDYQQQGFLVHPYSEVEPYLWRGQQFPPGEDQHPAVLVSYEDALAYAAWRSSQTGHAYRLPTADEWEKAARGSDGRYFPWGNEWQDSATNWGGVGLMHTSAIATFAPSRSPYGVEDMAGNVFEYTSSLEPRGVQTVAVMKGCSWDDLPGFCRAAYRHTRPIQSRHILFGFRLVRE